MRWVRSGMAAVGLGMVVAAAVGLAASLSFSGGSLGAATTATGRCTNAGLTVLQNLSGIQRRVRHGRSDPGGLRRRDAARHRDCWRSHGQWLGESSRPVADQ